MSARDIVVREARTDELDAIGELTLRSYDTVTAFSAEYRAELGNAHLRASTGAIILVGLLGDRVAGSMALSLGPTEMFEHRHGIDGDANFRMLAVHPELEGHGVGRALVQHAIERARDRGLRRMVITSMELMHRAHLLYEQFGFTRRPDLDVRYPSGIGHCFTLDLSADAADHFPPPGPTPAEPRWYLDDHDPATGPPPVACT